MNKEEIKKRNKLVPKIIIGIPTYEGKNYCLDQFLDNISKFSYPKDRIELFIADNSNDNKNALMINKKYGIKTFWKDYTDLSVFEKLADSHNQIRRFFLESNADYLFHLESDIFPPSDIIEKLLWCRKPIVNGLYMILDGAKREVCQRLDDRFLQSAKIIGGNLALGHFWHSHITGKVEKCDVAGIGCCLMKRKVMKNFEFRSDTNNSFPPDSYFALDLKAKGVQNYTHTGMVCFHWNREEWGRHFELIKYHKSE